MKDRRRTFTEAEICFRNPSRKENFEEEPNRKVSENTVPHRVKAVRGRQVGRKKSSVVYRNDDRGRGKQEDSWKTVTVTQHINRPTFT